jgi:exopolysaccharide production protein ExoY
VRPGLTGAWAVHGRSRVGYPTRASIELGYVRNWTLAADLGILARTPGAVFTQRGAF